MGNSQSTQNSPPLTIPPLNPLDKDVADKKDNQPIDPPLIQTTHSLRNPGTVEELSKQCKDVFPTVFDGFRMIFNKGLSNHFQISHTMTMSNLTPAGYRFGATYVGTNMVGPGEAYPILLGDIDPSGNLNANIIHQFHPRVKSKVVAQFQDGKCAAAQMSTDYKADTYTATCTLVNVDPVNRTGIAVGHFLKNLTPKLDLGCEILTQRGGQMGSGTSLSLVGRYTSPDNFILSGTVQPAACRLNYYKKIKENFQAGVEFESNLMLGECSASFGYQVDVPKADLIFRGTFDTNWQVGAVLEKKLQPLPLTFTLSGAVDHSGKLANYKFGMGLIIG